MIKLILDNINSITEIYFEDQAKADEWIISDLDLWKSFNEPIAEQFSVNFLEVGFEPHWIAFRQKRDMVLAACDYTQLVDAPITPTVKANYKEYRKYLRDLPDVNSELDPRSVQILTYDEWMLIP